ncbi:MAG: nucleoside 2-deoxyribosyltransferase [Aestuariivita sp.]|nr:nucleoside 2-deoxyribosyltransferase [Aestuariivita sp.]
MMLYISGALHSSSNLNEARKLYETTAKLVEQKGASFFLPHKQNDPVRAAKVSSEEVFTRDFSAIQESSALVAFLNEASHGVGAEVALCLEWGKPILPLLEASRTCSRFLEGLLRSRSFEIVRYQNTEDISRTLDCFIRSQQSRILNEECADPLPYGNFGDY